MAVPDYQSFMLPVLRLAAKGEISVRESIQRIAKEFSLSDEDRSELLPSGKQTKLANRVHWAKTYLVQAGLLEITRRAHFKATQRGFDTLQKGLEKIDNSYLEQFAEFRDFKSRARASQGKATPAADKSEQATPEEQIESAFEEINSELRQELLERITGSTPAFFEQVVVDLMVAMGYGGNLTDAVRRLGRSGDGGIDGVINEDTLGLDSVYIQAKRYAPGNGVGVERVREFAGSLVERGANKGVFVTTSHFAQGALDYADRIPQKLVLFDGEQLTRLMVRHGVGVRSTRSIELKKLDLDYFEQDEAG